MRYTADEERNKRCQMGKNYIKDEENKIIIYNPSENHRGEHDFTTMDSINNMLAIAGKERGYTVKTTINSATFEVVSGMTFEDAWAAFQKALKTVAPVKKDLNYEAQEQKRLAGIKSLDTAELISRLSEVYIPGVDFDNSDVGYVLKHMKDYKYDDKKDVNQNIIDAFPQYPLRSVADAFRQIVTMYKSKQMDVREVCSREYIVAFAERMGIPAKIPLDGRYMMALSQYMEAGRE